MVPKRSRQALAIAATLAPEVTSQAKGTMRSRTAPASDSVSSRRSGSRSTASTSAPSSASRTAMARPLPQPAATQPAPVTIATLSWNLGFMC